MHGMTDVVRAFRLISGLSVRRAGHGFCRSCYLSGGHCTDSSSKPLAWRAPGEFAA
jgi:hypothetical protein